MGTIAIIVLIVSFIILLVIGVPIAYSISIAGILTMLVSIDSTLPNRFFPQAVDQGLVPPLAGWRVVRREPPLGRGRADFLLRRGGEEMMVEVKSITWVESGVALFPDAPTQRGRRHVRELAQLARRGQRAGVVFVVQRPDAERFGPSPIDPAFSAAFEEALEAGVETWALVCRFDGEGLSLARFLDRGRLVLPAR